MNMFDWTPSPATGLLDDFDSALAFTVVALLFIVWVLIVMRKRPDRARIEDQFPSDRCPRCKGFGALLVVVQTVNGDFVRNEPTIECDLCHGGGR